MPIVVGITGGTGSGKTTVARAVAGAFLDRAVMIDQDCFQVLKMLRYDLNGCR